MNFISNNKNKLLKYSIKLNPLFVRKSYELFKFYTLAINIFQNLVQ